MNVQTEIRPPDGEVFGAHALDENIGKRYAAGVLVAAKVADDGRSAVLTIEIDTSAGVTT